MKKTKMAAFLRRVVLVVAAMIVGLCVYNWNAETIVGNRMPMPFGYGAAVVLTGSMEPAISANDVIFAREASEYGVGDIVVYQDRDMLIVHRVVSVNDNIIQTKGDANNIADEPVAISQVKGKVIGRIPSMGGVVHLVKNPVVVVAILAAAVFLTESSYRKEKEKDEDELERIKAEIRMLKGEQE